MTIRHEQLLAEFMGTGFLVCGVVGSGIMGAALTDDVALALLGNTLATGAILFVLITIFAPISGAHFNPAVTLVFMLQRTLTVRQGLMFILVQCAGGIVGVVLAHGMFDLDLLQISDKARGGFGQILAEGVATFGLVLVILGAQRHRPSATASVVGLYITAGYWFTASTSFANPAVTLARALTDSFSGIAPVFVPGFVIGQLIGALLASAAALVLFSEKKELA